MNCLFYDWLGRYYLYVIVNYIFFINILCKKNDILNENKYMCSKFCYCILYIFCFFYINC